MDLEEKVSPFFSPVDAQEKSRPQADVKRHNGYQLPGALMPVEIFVAIARHPPIPNLYGPPHVLSISNVNLENHE